MIIKCVVLDSNIIIYIIYVKNTYTPSNYFCRDTRKLGNKMLQSYMEVFTDSHNGEITQVIYYTVILPCAHS